MEHLVNSETTPLDDQSTWQVSGPHPLLKDNSSLTKTEMGTIENLFDYDMVSIWTYYSDFHLGFMEVWALQTNISLSYNPLL